MSEIFSNLLNREELNLIKGGCSDENPGNVSETYNEEEGHTVVSTRDEDGWYDVEVWFDPEI